MKTKMHDEHPTLSSRDAMQTEKLPGADQRKAPWEQQSAAARHSMERSPQRKAKEQGTTNQGPLPVHRDRPNEPSIGAQGCRTCANSQPRKTIGGLGANNPAQ